MAEKEHAFEKPRSYLEILVLILLLSNLFAVLVISVHRAGFIDDFNWGLFIPGMIAVVGSFSLYRYREKRKQERLRLMLKIELEQMDCLDTLEETIDDLKDSDTPPNNHLPPSRLPAATEIPTAVYDANSNQLGRLDEEEMIEIVDFYTQIKVHKQTIENIHTEEASIKAEESLCDDIEDLVETKNVLTERFDS